MKHFLKSALSILCILLIINFPFCYHSFAITSESSSSSSKSLEESNLTSNDWKIVIDDKNTQGDFSFIQNNKASSIFNNSDSLLIYGIVFLVIGATGLTIISIIIIKNHRKLSNQNTSINKERSNKRATSKKNNNTKYKH